MIRQKHLFLVVLALAGWIVVTPPASAEWVTDISLGAANHQKEDVAIQIEGLRASEKVDFDTSFTLGARVAYWFESAPWLGLAPRASVFNPDPDLTVLPR